MDFLKAAHDASPRRLMMDRTVRCRLCNRVIKKLPKADIWKHIRVSRVLALLNLDPYPFWVEEVIPVEGSRSLLSRRVRQKDVPHVEHDSQVYRVGLRL